MESGTTGSFGFTRDDSSSDDTSSRASARSQKNDPAAGGGSNGTGERKEPFGGNPSPSQPKKGSSPSLPVPGGVFPLHAAIKKHSLSEFKKLMEKEPMDKVDEEGRTILHLAAKEAQVDIVKLILKKKNWLNFDQQDREGFTALHYSIMAGDIKTFEILLKAGASTRALTRTGNTILHTVCSNRRWAKSELKCVKLLLSKPWPEINSTNGEGVTALQMACQRGLYDAAVAMLKAKADPTIFKGGEPVLFNAVYAENPGLVKALLESGADVSQFNSAGQSLMEIVNPKCEIYRIIKRFMLSRPGGERKLNLISEDALVATKVAELPPEFKRMVQASGLAAEDIEKHWDVFCNVMHFVGKRRIFMTEEEAQKARDKIKQGNASVPISENTKRLQTELFAPGNPKKLFKKLRIAGKGGFGMVFSGIGPDKKTVAIKRMPHTSEKDRVQNLTEAMFLKRCNHPNIVYYQNTYESPDDHEIWIVMEMLSGGTLDEAIDPDAQASFSETHIAYVCREMLYGIHYLHNNRVAHRDLKAPNVMMSVEGDVKLIDFGLAVDLGKSGARTEMVGSPYWIPPEMVLRKPHSYPVDIWSMAICILALANKHAPNYGSPLKCMFSVATKAPPTFDQPNRWSNDFRDFMTLMLVQEAEKRATADFLLKHPFLNKAARKDEMKKLLSSVFISHKLQQVAVI